MNKYVVTQELANAFPPWSKIHSDEQSNGYMLLNCLAAPMERMEEALIKQQTNNYLASVNLDEIDLSYHVALPETFEFVDERSDLTVPTFMAPEVSGLLDGIWYPVPLADNNDVQTYWYESYPNRVSIGDTVTGVSHELLTFSAADYSITGVWHHHLDAGSVWIGAYGGVQYIQVSGNDLTRGRVILNGRTRSGQLATETLIFPWDMTQESKKDWEELYSIEARDMESGVSIFVNSANFNAEDRLSPWNLRFSENRNKVDEIWGLGVLDTKSTLDRIGYISDEWQQLIQGFVDKESKIRFELLNTSGVAISGVDMAIQPFSNKAWVVTTEGGLYCYSLQEDMVSGINLLKERTPGSEVQLDVPNRYVLLGEDIYFTPWHAKPVREVLRFRSWIQTPSGTKYGTMNGDVVSGLDWQLGGKLNRVIGEGINFTASERGEYLIVLEAEFADNAIHIDKVIVTVASLEPEVYINLTSLVPYPVTGIDFDSDQKMWLLAGGNYYQINLHTDIMLIDYKRKVIYFKEPYEEVGIDT